jgi:hypothetical protein
MLKNIEANGIEGKRNIETLNISGYKTDVPSEFLNNIPPFPLLIEVKENGEEEVVYPGDILEFETQPEITFVKKCANAISYFGDNLKRAEELINLSKKERSEGGYNLNNNNFLLYRDLLTDINKHSRNYNVLWSPQFRDKINDEKQITEWITRIFTARLAAYGKIHYWAADTVAHNNRIIETEAKLLFESRSYYGDAEQKWLEQLNKVDSDTVLEYYDLYNNSKDIFPNLNPNTKLDTKIGIDDILIIHKQGTIQDCETFIKDKFYMTSDILVNGIDEVYNSPNNNGTKYLEIEKQVLLYKEGTENKSKVTYACDMMNYTNDNIKFFDKAFYVGEKTVKFFSNYYTLRTGENCNDKNADIEVSRKSNNVIINLDIRQILTMGEFYGYGHELIEDEKNESRAGSTNFYYTNKPLLKGYKTNEEGVTEIFYQDIDFVEELRKLSNDLYIKYLRDTGQTSGIPDINEYEYNYPFVVNKFDFKEIDINNYSVVLSMSKPYNNQINKNNVYAIFELFKKKVFELYGYAYTSEDIHITEQNKVEIKSKFEKELYYTLKSIYDKWFSSLNNEIFRINHENSEFKKIKYLTTTFSDISEKLVVDIDKVNSIFSFLTNSSESLSMIELMAKIAQDNNCSFLTIPNYENTNMDDLFKPYENNPVDFNDGIRYIVMYNVDVSHNLEIEGSSYENDTFDIASYRGNIVNISDDAKRYFSDTSGNTIHAFGVTYGMQNQNFFKNIYINTNNPITTDYSIANTLILSNSNSGINSVNYINKRNLFPVYANRSYHCTVEMMGCASITPLMYFQLNNIPMFKGAYIIINVKHIITPNDFTTIFEGVRVSKYKLPLNNKTWLSCNLSDLMRAGDITSTSHDGINEKVQVKSMKDYDTKLGHEIINLDINGASHVRYDSTGDCWLTGLEIMRKYLKSKDLPTKYIGDRDHVIRLLCEHGDGKSRSLYYYTYEKKDGGFHYKDKSEKYKEAIETIEYHLNNGYMIMVGVNHTIGKTGSKTNKPEWTTDHFIVIYAYGTVKDSDEKYYRYFETGASEKTESFNKENYLIYKPNGFTGPLFYNGSARNGTKRYDVTQVRPYIFGDKSYNLEGMHDNDCSKCKTKVIID